MKNDPYHWPCELRGQINCYTCRRCYKNTLLLLLDSGTTPFGIQCPHCMSHECLSNMYKIEFPRGGFTLGIKHAMFRPTIEYLKMVANGKEGAVESYRDHCNKGGLLNASLNDALANRIDLDPPDGCKRTADEWITVLEKYYGNDL